MIIRKMIYNVQMIILIYTITISGKCPPWISPNYWGYKLQQLIEHHVKNKAPKPETYPATIAPIAPGVHPHGHHPAASPSRGRRGYVPWHQIRCPASRELRVGSMVEKNASIKGPENRTSQLLPMMSDKGCSRDGQGRKGKGGGEGSKS